MRSEFELEKRVPKPYSFRFVFSEIALPSRYLDRLDFLADASGDDSPSGGCGGP